MPQFFFEIYQEEIPARMQKGAAAQLEKLLGEILNDLQLDYQTITTMVTPLRLIGCVDDIAETSKEVITRIRGPKEGIAAAIVDKFKASHANCHSREGGNPSQCGTVDPRLREDDAEPVVTFTAFDGYIYAEKITKPKATANLIPSLIDQILQRFTWSKTMRWPGSTIEWIRPIRRIYCNYDHHPLIFSLPNIGLDTSDHVTGHRFMSTEHLQPVDFDNYLELLSQNYVLPDHQKRCAYIHDQLSSHGDYLIDQALIEENAGLAEWPIVYLGNIEQRFLALPQEVLTTTMKVHQRYFTFPNQPTFGVVANAQPEDCGAMVAGYERVLRARLSDAQFFYQQDCNKPLEDFLPKLETIVFHKNIGTLADKTRRLEAFMETPEGKTAARLCKADLVASVVYEFPELQGIMGRIYAEHAGLAPEICNAIEQHYWPTGVDNPLPTSLLGAQLAFADKLDTLLGLIGTGIQISSSKDPLGLRRCALGIIRLVVAFGFDFDSACTRWGDNFDATNKTTQFIKDRAFVYFKDQGISDEILRGLAHLPVTTMIHRIPEVTAFVGSEEGQAFLVQYKRLCGLLKPHTTAPLTLNHPFEITLNDWNIQRAPLSKLEHLLVLTQGMRDYFDAVKVLEGTESQFNGRLTLLAHFKTIVDRFCIFG